jgi:hypothetical protein
MIIKKKWWREWIVDYIFWWCYECLREWCCSSDNLLKYIGDNTSSLLKYAEKYEAYPWFRSYSINMSQ